MRLTLLSAGSNAHGQLGHSANEDSPRFLLCSFEGLPRGDLPNGTSRIIDVATGANHTVVLLETITGNPEVIRRELWACGDGRSGQLGSWQQQQHRGTSDTFRKLDLPLEDEGLQEYQCKLIAAGWETTYLVFSPLPSDSPEQERSDVVLSMGADDWGDLGIGSKSSAKPSKRAKQVVKPVNRVTFDHFHIGGAASSSGGVLVVEAVAAKQHHVVLHLREKVTGKGWILGWGAARHGQVSPPSTAPLSNTTLSLKPTGTVDRPQLVLEEDLDDPFLTCCVGSQHSLVLKTSGRIIGIGSNRKNQLDIESWSGVRMLGCTWNSTFAAVSGSDIRTVGSNSHGQLGCGPIDTASGTGNLRKDYKPVFPNALQTAGLTKLASGSEHVLTLWGAPSPGALPEVWSWGWNEHGNLGTGAKEDVHAPAKVYPDSTGNFAVLDIWAGSGTSWICCRKPEDE